MRKIWLGLLFALLATTAHAQSTVRLCVMTSSTHCEPVTSGSPLPILGSFSASPFQWNGGSGSLTATASSSSSTAIPSGTPTTAVLRMANTGTTAVSCVFATGAATATASNIIIQPASAVVRAVGSYDHVACIDQTGSASNVVVLESGTGLGNDSGGGGGGGGSSTITNWGSGTNTLGAMANYGTPPGAVLVPGVNAFVTNTNANGQATMANSSPVVVASDQSAIPMSPQAITTGGTTPYHLIAAASDNSTGGSALAGAHTIYSIQTGNISGTTPAYLKFYDKATAPTCASDTVVKTILIPANSLGGGNNISMSVGQAFTSGIGFCVVAGIADNNDTSVSAATVIINFGYK